MDKKMITVLGPLVVLITLSVIIINNFSNSTAVEAMAPIETNLYHEESTALQSVTPSEPIKEEEIEENKENTTDTTVEDTTKDIKVDEDTTDSDITPLDQIMYAQEEVNTHSGPSTDYEKVDSLSLNEEVHITGQSKSTGWYEIDLNGSKQYVSDQYLATTKVQATTTATDDLPTEDEIASDYELTEEDQAIIDQIEQEIMAEHPEWFTDTAGNSNNTGNYEHVGTPSTGELPNTGSFGTGDYSELEDGGTVY